jgi:hypothetical protein
MSILSSISVQVKDITLSILLLMPFYVLNTVYFSTYPDDYCYLFTAIQLAEGQPIVFHLESPLKVMVTTKFIRRE